MNLLPAFAPTSKIADLFTRPLPTISHHRYTQLVIGDGPITPTPLSASAHLTATVDSATVAPTSPTTVDSLAAVVDSDSVTTFHPNLDPAPLSIVVDTGASYSVSDFALEVTQAPYGLIRSPTLVVSDSKACSAFASTPVDPYTLITGEDAVAFDLSSPDTTSDSGTSFTKVSFDIRQFGTASLTFIFSPNLSLIKVFVTPTQVDWIHWVPLPRLTPTESYFHIFGRDYLQAFALFHLIPLWIALVSALLRSK